MRKPSSRTRRLIALSAGPIAVLVAGLLVWQASNGAFSSSTRNPGNSWSTGNVTLTDDDTGRAGFTVANMVPGQSGEKCIKVTATSNSPGVVKAYVENLDDSAKGLEDHIKLDVTKGTGGDFDSCTGFVADPNDLFGPQPLSTLATVNHDFATGGAPWATTGNASGESKVYKGTWTFDTTGLTQNQIDALQGATTSIDLVWELQNDDQ